MIVVLVVLAILVISLWAKRAPHDRVVRAFGGQNVKFPRSYLFSNRKNAYMRVNEDEDSNDSLESRLFITWETSRSRASTFIMEGNYTSLIDGFIVRIQPFNGKYAGIYLTFDTNTGFPEPIFSKKSTQVFYLNSMKDENAFTYPRSFLKYGLPEGEGREARLFFIDKFYQTFDGFGYKPCKTPSADDDSTCISKIYPIPWDNNDLEKLDNIDEIAKSLAR